METMNRNQTSSEVYHSSNPFITPIVQQIQDSKNRKIVGHSFQDVVDTGTGNIMKQKILVLGEQKVVDKQEYSKLYMGQIQRFFGLSKSCLRLLDYIMDNIRYGEDRICLFYPDVKEKLDISKGIMYSSIRKLIEVDIIARANTKGCYYINPAVVFKGDRVALVQQWVVDSTPSEYEMETMHLPITEYAPGVEE